MFITKSHLPGVFSASHQTGFVGMYKKLYILGVFWREEIEISVQIVWNNTITIIIHLAEEKDQN